MRISIYPRPNDKQTVYLKALCWCIGKAASGVKEFYMLPVGRELLRYDTIAVNTIVKNKTERSAPVMCRFRMTLRNSMPTICA